MDLVDMSLYDTAFLLYRSRKEKAAEEMKSTFKLPDSRYPLPVLLLLYVAPLQRWFPSCRMWHIQIRVHAQQRNWPAMQKLCESKRSSPIGYEPFADICIDLEEYEEAVQYINRISDAAVRCKYFVRTRHWDEAIEIAVKRKDKALLELIASKCTVPEIRARVASML
jgi:vacuolar protein sorting-associated protein 16